MSKSQKSSRTSAVEPAAPDPSAEGGMGPGSDHVRPPRQERSRKTLERLVRAALEIISEEGVGGATIAAIVERAGSSVGSFYARFDGKDDLLHYLEERVWRKASKRWTDARASRSWEGLDLEGVVRSVVELLVRIHREDAGTRRALGRDAVGEELGEEARRFHALLAEEVRELILLRRESIRHPSPEQAARVAYGWAVGGIRELLRAGQGSMPGHRGGGPDRRPDGGSGAGSDGGAEGGALEPEVVAEEITRGLVAYLAGGVEPPEDPGEVEFFDVWQ